MHCDGKPVHYRKSEKTFNDYHLSYTHAKVPSDGKPRQFEVGFTVDLPMDKAFRKYCRRHIPTCASIQSNAKTWSFSVTDSYATPLVSILRARVCVQMAATELIWRSAA